jgi:hypothetical protein
VLLKVPEATIRILSIEEKDEFDKYESLFSSLVIVAIDLIEIYLSTFAPLDSRSLA